MIFVTHDHIEAMTPADHIVVLRDGVIELEGGHVMTTAFVELPTPETKVTVGIRPEDLLPVADGGGVLTGTVQIAEQLGGETYVCVELPNGHTITAEIKGQADVRTGQSMDLVLEHGKLHVFGP